MKKGISIFILFCIFVSGITVNAQTMMLKEKEDKSSIETNALTLHGKSAVLMEATTGQILYEWKKDEAMPPASVTKIMTLLLIFEDLDAGKIKLTDPVTVSSHAASMGGSQVFLEAGEVQTVETLMKCISIASANDGCVAMAEHLNGSEEAFVNRMNEKAEKLGMKNTHFVNCCGLDTEGHMTSAYDIGIMSRELTVKYPQIYDYSSIWMDEFIHKTAKGETTFGLSNTNKMIRTYEGCNGLKTGSTSRAGFCLSATAKRNDISLIAVVMGCPDSKTRTADVTKMLDYGFANVKIYEDAEPLGDLKKISVVKGKEEQVGLSCEKPFRCILLKNEEESKISKNVKMMEHLQAPVKEGEIIGEIEYTLNGKVIGAISVKTTSAVEKKDYLFSLKQLWKQVTLDT